MPTNRCPVCQSSFIRPIAPRWWQRAVSRWMKGVPAQCWHCGWRGRMEFVAPPGPDTAAAADAPPPAGEAGATPSTAPASSAGTPSTPDPAELPLNH